MIKAVFFDLDGTLLDTSKDLGQALNAVRIAQGLTPFSDDITRKEVSNGANALVKLGFGDALSQAQHAKYRQALLDYYLAHIAEHTFAFEGIAELITQLANANMAWGIVTNKPALYTQALMKHFNFASAPVATISPDHVAVAKPDPEGILLACQQAQCPPAQAIYIGDHQRDIEAGNNAGTSTIAVGYGFTESPTCHTTWGADYTVDLATEIWPIIESLI